jgi:hypothetical protein
MLKQQQVNSSSSSSQQGTVRRLPAVLAGCERRCGALRHRQLQLHQAD